MVAINGFFFDRAKYRLSDSTGNEVALAVDYKQGKFKLVEVRSAVKGMRQLKKKAAEVARDLIKRKRNVNFSDKIGV